MSTDGGKEGSSSLLFYTDAVDNTAPSLISAAADYYTRTPNPTPQGFLKLGPFYLRS